MKLNKLIFIISFISLANFAYASCTTQTVIVGGKMQVCTVCGTVVSCM